MATAKRPRSGTRSLPPPRRGARIRCAFGSFLVATTSAFQLGLLRGTKHRSNGKRDLLRPLGSTEAGDNIETYDGPSSTTEEQLEDIAVGWLEDFQNALTMATGDESNIQHAKSVTDLFLPDECYWRDMVAFTWNIITLEGLEQIGRFAASLSSRRTTHDCASLDSPTTTTATTFDWKLDPSKALVIAEHDTMNKEPETAPATGTSSNKHNNHTLEFWASFSTAAGPGRAHVRLRLVDSDDNNNKNSSQAYTLLTVLSGLHPRPWQCAPFQQRPVLSPHGPIAGRRYWHEQKKQQQQNLAGASAIDDSNSQTNNSRPYVLIIGGGQAGLSLGARLQLLQVPYLICETGAQPGASWRRRYPSLSLHDPVYYNHLPYLPFPRTWPLFCPRDKLADWMAHYADALDLNVLCQTRVVRATRQDLDEGGGSWMVELECTTSGEGRNERKPTTTTTITKRVQHIVFATGNSSHPRIPSIPGRRTFRGLQLHSSQYKGGRAYKNRKLKHAVVIGSNNSAFDIAQDLWEQLAGCDNNNNNNNNDATADSRLESITMIQRTPSMVVSPDSVLRLGLGPLYAENAAVPHEEADLVATTVPYRLALEKWKQATRRMADNDAALLEGVAKAGYRLDSGPDGTGIFAKSASEGGGFYINVGCAELMMRGDVQVRYASVERMEEDAVVIRHKDDKREERLPADLIIYATGFHTMERWVSEICGEDVADQVGRTWGLGLGTMKDPSPWDGELRNMWKPTAVDGLWFQGGNLAQNRHYSRYLALQLAARYMGMETRVYGMPSPTPPPPRGV